MNSTLKNSLAVIAGILIGMVVNMGLIMISSSLIPPPVGIDNTTMEGLKAGMHLFEPKHFIMPFLAHALGTLIGAFVAAKFGATQHLKLALGVGAFFLLGGLTNVFLLPSPVWFTLLDLGLAYIPMALVANKLVTHNQ